ncbi:Isopentenyldiphosphate isomerase [Polaromonas sp. OV174]|uniref:NUDIX hydrolase n=1 Tax=Polaromonas sp. OV174 TaxID=1855300 RepID=UPI0008F3421F|nr:NUDIX domain-containing protein [Polaromonas sp. OV174]SFB80520.1 Isopentenyldiphosphate isomerase [Polaromonas sp. OV174]
MPLEFDAQWLRRLQAAASQAPLRPRVPLWAGDAVIGSVETDFLRQIALQPLLDGRNPLLKEEYSEQAGWRLLGDVTSGLNRVATALHEAGLAGAWRNEQLAVSDPSGQRQGTVERAAVRPLGIVTQAVHLVGQTPEGSVWVQQRALDKANDPGLWDTLMGGMVAAADTLETALARETWEEAGLRIVELQAMRYGGRLSICRPSQDGRGAGYVSEHIDWYVCTVPDGLTPDNQDGEVAQFCLMDKGQLLAALQRDEFTLEAALILLQVLGLP